MGACASVPKSMLAEAGYKAPAPEPKPEVEEEKVKPEGDDKENVDENDKRQSLEALLGESKEVKEGPESETTLQTETIPSEITEESKTKEVPIAETPSEADTPTPTEAIAPSETVKNAEEAKTEPSAPIAEESPESPVQVKTHLIPIARESPESPVVKKSEELNSAEFPVARVPMSDTKTEVVAPSKEVETIKEANN